ncbi:DUF1631 domain-containing protein [Dasania sp. GY-MA-18]|uniref:DUF1631 domain-containing protein n=1 Tax=Dasania TaxID=503005 RepID=UPI0021AC994F|nr:MULTISPECIES: DUF1631 domain-containing protein [Dasania]MCR8923669.1 DUF1631 domain-containing protein [Dasania sp. GY-MA-18]
MAIDSAYMQARLPAVFVDIKERAQQSCMPLLQALFDHVDDALFEMADKADSNAAQNMYFESMREVRLKRRGMELLFLKTIDEAFFAAVSGNSSAADQEEVPASELSLVEHDQLEELMASSSLVSKAEKNFVEPLALIMARLNALLGEQPTLTAASNPLGPAVICKAFMAACESLDTDINTKLVLFKLFDRYVIAGLGSVYSACNAHLASSGVLADANAANLVSGASKGATPQDSASAVFANLQALLKAAPHASASQQAVGLQAAGDAPQIPRDSLMALLQLVQQQAAQSAENSAAQLDIQQALNSLCMERMPGQALSIGQVDDDTINLVSMLFQFVLEDRNLAAPIKTQLSRMQIPIVRIAMQDKSFFSRGGHPARKLLNAMATAALGWEEPQQLDRDPLYKKIGAIVDQLLEDYDNNAELFDDILSDFNAFLELERRRASLIEQRTLDAEDGKAKSELARAAVKQLLQEKLQGVDLPPAVMSLLQDAWSNVLFLINLKEGQASHDWTEAVQVVDDLLWSVSPMDTGADRKRLLQLIPSLLNALRKGLTQVAFNPFEMNRLFDELENIHLAQLKQPLAAAAQTIPTLSEPLEQHDEQLISATNEPAPEAKPEAKIDSTAAQPQNQQPAQPAALEPVAAQASPQPPKEELAQAAGEQTLDQLLEGRKQPAANASADELLAELEELDELEGFGEDSDSSQPLPAISPEQAPSNHRVDQLAVGSWLEMLQDDGSKLRCRLAAIIRGTGKYIFVNRAGIKVAEHTRASLGQAVDEGDVSLLDDGLLFDRALESVIGNLREMKSQSAS